MTSFDFTWKSTAKPPKGKVFAKKRKTQEESANKPKTAKPPPETKTIQKILKGPTKSQTLPQNNAKPTQKKWKSTAKPPTGKVFAKTRKIQEESTNKPKTAKPPPETKTTQKILKGPTTSQTLPSNDAQATQKKFTGPAKKRVGFAKTQEKQSEFQPNKLVKRKQKKDKLAAKAARDLGEVPDGTQGQSGNQFNKGKLHSLFSEKHKNLYVKTDGKGKSLEEKVFSKGQKFSDLNLHKYLVSNLEKINFTTLTTVQEKAIPVVLSGKNVLVRSQTGSGKTLAYAVPILSALQNLDPKVQRKDGVQAIIVVPTRELALQTHELFGKINTFQWIVVGHLCGGENRKTEKDRLRKGVHILIATPGRLLDHILHTAAFKIDNTRCLVLDEADRLLDMGFKRDIVSIVEELDKARENSYYNPLAMLKRESAAEEAVEETDGMPLESHSNKTRQTLLLSATLSKAIAELADFTMKDHIYVDALDEGSTVNPEHMVIPSTVSQEFVVTFVKHRLITLSALLVAKSKKNSKLFVFMATSHMVDYHYELFTQALLKMPINRGKVKSGDVVLLENAGEDSDDEEEEVLDIQLFKLHGSMNQSARKEVFTGFRAAKTGVLLCTDVAARGLDVPAADCIIQYTGPQSDDDYLHRVGRTGRAGKSGSALIFLTHEEQDYISRLQEHKVFLKEHPAEDFLKHLCDLMEEPEHERAAMALQRRYEDVLSRNRDLHKMACFAFSSWSRFYNTYPSQLRTIFDFKNVNLGHYVTSFGLKDTPTSASRLVRGQVANFAPKKLNRKLATHEDDQNSRPAQKRKIKSISLTTSEFSSGLAPAKKKKKKMD